MDDYKDGKLDGMVKIQQRLILLLKRKDQEIPSRPEPHWQRQLETFVVLSRMTEKEKQDSPHSDRYLQGFEDAFSEVLYSVELVLANPS